MIQGFKTNTGWTKNVRSILYLSLRVYELDLSSNKEFWAIHCIKNRQNSTCFRNKNCLKSKNMDVLMEIGTFRAQGSSPRTLPNYGIMVTQITDHKIRCRLVYGLCYSYRARLQNISYIPYCCGCQPNSTLKCEMWGSHSGTTEIQRPVRCDAASLCK